MSRDTVMILGGGILQVPLVEECHKMGFRTVVTDIDDKCACRDITDMFWLIDVFNSSAHVKWAIRVLESVSVQIIGCIAAGIDAIETAEKVNGWIRTQTNNKHGFWAGWMATAICRDKTAFRMHQKTHNFNYPKYIVLGTRSFHEFELPIIIKPVDSSGGRGMTIFRDKPSQEDLTLAENKANKSSKMGKCLLEELLIGKEYTVETIWEDGKMYPAFITDRYFRNDDKYAIEAGASHPTHLTEMGQSFLYLEMRKLGESLGMTYGPLKGDLMVVKTQKHRDLYETKIYILEATTRYSGGFDCQYLVPMATGKNILRAAIECNVYGKFDKDLLKAKWDKHSMIGSPFPKEGTIKDFSFPPTYFGDKFFQVCEIGDEIKYVDSTSRVTFLIVSRETRLEAVQAMKEGLENIKIEVE